jgi:hypothetical protein
VSKVKSGKDASNGIVSDFDCDSAQPDHAGRSVRFSARLAHDPETVQRFPEKIMRH